MKKAGPDLCFQPLFKLVALDDEDYYEGMMGDNDSSCSNQSIGGIGDNNQQATAKNKGVRFASLLEDKNNEIAQFSDRATNMQPQFEERPLASGLIFLPSLSKKGLIAVKNPFITKSQDEATVRKASVNALNNFLRANKHKRISLVDIIFLICQRVHTDSN